jgi:Domain of unknown function (DUF4337)
MAALAALGTLFSHHRSIAALTAKNQAILAQARATDAYNAYEAKQIRYDMYQAFLATDMVAKPEARAALKSLADRELGSAPSLQQNATALEEEVVSADERSGTLAKSYETLLLATTLFELSIILVSLSALALTRILLSLGSGLSAIGVVLLVLGLFQGR